MKKLLLFCFALSALAFTACEKEDSTSSEDLSGYDYTLTISPSTVKVGDDITLTVKGDGVNDMIWMACFNRVDDGSGSCLVVTFVDGVATANLSSTYFSAGEYKFYASSGSTTDAIKTNYASVTVTE